MCMKREKITFNIKKYRKIVQSFGTLFLPPKSLDFFPGFPSQKCCNDETFLMPPKGFLCLTGGEVFRHAGCEHSQTKIRIYSSSWFWVSSISIS